MSLEVRWLRRSQLSNFYNQKPKLRLRTHRKHKKQERSTTVSKIQSLEEACLCVHLITLTLYLLPSDLDRNSSAPVVSVTLHIQYCVTRSLSRYTLTFSTLSSLRLLWYWQGEFIWQLKVSKINDFLFFSWPHHLIQEWYRKVKLEVSHGHYSERNPVWQFSCSMKRSYKKSWIQQLKKNYGS